MHPVNWEFRFYFAVNALEGMQDKAEQRIVHAFEQTIGFC
jgi:hypothetical protein